MYNPPKFSANTSPSPTSPPRVSPVSHQPLHLKRPSLQEDLPPSQPPSQLAVESTVHLAVAACIPANAALSSIAVPRLRRILEVDGLRVNAPNLNLKHVRKLAVNAFVYAARDAQKGDSTDGILEGILDGDGHAVVEGAAAGAFGALVLLVLDDVHAAPAVDVVRSGAFRGGVAGLERIGAWALGEGRCLERQGSEEEGCEGGTHVGVLGDGGVLGTRSSASEID